MKPGKWTSRLTAVLLILCMFLTELPVYALEETASDPQCPYHAVHDGECGYDEEGGSPCQHVCGACITPARLREIDGSFDESIEELEQLYFGDEPEKLTPEYQQALMDLYAAMQEDGKITASLPEGRGAAETSGAPYKLYETGVKNASGEEAQVVSGLTITLPEAEIVKQNDENEDVELTFRLSAAADYPVSFRLSIMDGSARKDDTYALSDAEGYLSDQATTLTFPAGTTELTVKIDMLHDERHIDGGEGGGATVFYLLYDRPVNAVFAGRKGTGKYAAYTQVTNRVSNPYDLKLLGMMGSSDYNIIKTGEPDAEGKSEYFENLHSNKTGGGGRNLYGSVRALGGRREVQIRARSASGLVDDGEGALKGNYDVALMPTSWTRHTFEPGVRDLIADGIANELKFDSAVEYDRSGDNWIWAYGAKLLWGNGLTYDINQKKWSAEETVGELIYRDTAMSAGGHLNNAFGSGNWATEDIAMTEDAQDDGVRYSASRTYSLTPDKADLQLGVQLIGACWWEIPSIRHGYVPIVDVWAQLDDTKAPEVVGITVPEQYGPEADSAMKLGSGGILPITVEFSEPVNGYYKLYMADGRSILAAENPGTNSKYRTFLYKIGDKDNTQLVVDRVTSCAGTWVKDIKGNQFINVDTGQPISDTAAEYPIYRPADGTLTVSGSVIETPLKELAFLDKNECPQVIYPDQESSYIRSDDVQISIPLRYGDNPADDYSKWIADKYGDTDALPHLKLTLEGEEATDGKRRFYDLNYAKDQNGDPVYDTLIASFPAEHLKTGTYRPVLWISDEDAPAEEGKAWNCRPVFFETPSELTLTEAYVESIALTASGNGHEIKAPAEGEAAEVKLSSLIGETDQSVRPIELEAILTPGRVSYPEVVWTVENASAEEEEPIAQIAPDAEDPLKAALTLTGKSYGELIVTATAEKGSKDPENPVTQTFRMNIVRDVSIFAGNAATVRLGNGCTVSWVNSDAKAYEEAGVSYAVKLFRADGEGKPSGEALQMWDTKDVSVPVEAGMLTEISQFSKEAGAYLPAYVAEITVQDLFNPGKTLTAYAPVTVYPKPVSIQLKPEDESYNSGLFLLDSEGSFSFTGTVTDWMERGEENSEVTVTKNDEPYADFTCTVDDTVSGKLNLAQVADGNLKDVYVITVKAKNNNQTLFSSDSMILQVYDKEALKVVVENAEGEVTDTLGGGEQIILSNYGEGAVHDGKLDVSNLAPEKMEEGDLYPKDMENLLALKRRIDLKKYLHVNYEGIGWNTVADRMSWNSSNDRAARLNYRNATIFEDIKLFDYTSYRPDEVLMLTGHEDGETKITVTHGRTGNTMDFDVLVQTLKDKLYLFQVWPEGAAQVRYDAYTDAERTKTEERVMSTNDRGEFAVYEEYGIAGDVRFERTDSNGDTWLGTIFNQNLLTQENDASKLELYPLNNMPMRKVTVQKFFLKDEAGEPFTGDVRLSYGVYKNGEFCPRARVNANEGDQYARDKQIMTAAEGGMITLRFDSTQFVTQEELDAGYTESKLTPKDELRYIVEMEFGSEEDGYTAYQPRVVELNANINEEQTVRSGDSVLNLVKTVEKRKAFVDSYRVQYKDALKASYDCTYNTGYIGISEEFPEIDLNSRIIWWNTTEEELDNASLYAAEMTDLEGIRLNGQKSSTVVYPFGNFPVTTAVLAIDAELFGGKSFKDEDYEPIASKCRLYDEDGSLYAVVSAPFKMANLTGADLVKDFSQPLSLGSAKTVSATGMLPMSMFERDAVPYASGDNADAGGGVDGSAFESGGFDGGEMANGALDGLSIGFPSLLPVRYNFVATDDPTQWKMIGVIEMGLGNDPDADASSAPNEKMSNSLKDTKEAFNDMKNGFAESRQNMNSPWKGSVNASASIMGFVEGTLYRDPKTGKTSTSFDGGGLVVSGSAGYTFSANTFLGPVPVTYSIGAGADLTIGLEFSPMSEAMQDGGADIRTDFLSTVQFVAWAKAFAGVGIDFDIIAIKLGVFGEMYAGVNVKTLNQAYRKDHINTSYNYFNVGGEIGLKLELRLLVAEYEKVLVSGKLEYHRLDKIAGRPEYNAKDNMPEKLYESFDNDGADLPEGLKPKEESAQAAAKLRNLSAMDMANMHVVSATLKAEERNYLENPTVWAGPEQIQPFALDEVNAFESIGWNVYPGSEPEIARDGSFIVFRTDNASENLNDTGIGWAVRTDGAYVKQEGSISGSIMTAAGVEKNTPVTNLDFDGTQSFGVAAWEQQNEATVTEAGEEMTLEDTGAMMKRTEIVLSVIRDGEWGEPLRLTDNAVADMAPEVAVSSSGQAIVAWRQPAASSDSDPTTFNASDEIVYSLYDGSEWSEVRQLDIGDLGAVKGFDAAIADDGTAIVTSCVQLSGPTSVLAMENNATKEITYTMIRDGQPGDRVRVTTDNAVDENPQLAYADGSFLLAWHSTEEMEVVNPVTGAPELKAVNDIKLRSIGTDGTADAGFVNSISAINKTRPTEVGADFTMAQGTSGSLEETALIWKTAEQSQSASEDEIPVYDRDVVHAVKFLKDDSGRVQVTAPQELADMGDSVTADHVSSYVSGNTIKSVIMKSEMNTDVVESYEAEAQSAVGNAETVALYGTVSSMVSATLECSDSISVEEPLFDNEMIRKNSGMPVQFTVLNTGLTPITSITATIGGESETYEELNLMPNDVYTVHAECKQGDSIEDQAYTVQAAFASGETAQTEGTLKLTMPDVSIGKVEVLEELKGTREFGIGLYNGSDYSLKEHGYAVKLDIYDDQTREAEPVESVIIDGDEDLAQIDEKGYVYRTSYTIPEDRLENGEIPEGGVKLYISAAVIDKETKEPVKELDSLYNDTSLSFESLYKDNVQFRTDAILDNSGEVSKATVTVKNLSLKKAAEKGNVLVTLLDGMGNALETVSLASNEQDLFDLEGEDLGSRTVTFTQKGDSVTTRYLPVADGNDYNNELLLLSAGGKEYSYEELKAQPEGGLTQETVNLPSTLLTAVSKSPDAQITVSAVGESADTVLAKGTGNVALTWTLAYGEKGTPKANTVRITVKPKDANAEEQSYLLTLNNTRDVSGKVVIESSPEMTNGWTNTQETVVSLTASDLKNFTPVSWEYNVNNEGWKQAQSKARSETRALTSLTEEGEYVVQGRVVDADGFAMASESMTVKIDRTAPVIDEANVRFIETEQELLKKTGAAGFFAKLFGLDKDGNTDRQLKVTIPATDDRSGIASVVLEAQNDSYVMTYNETEGVYEGTVLYSSRGPLTITATDLAGNTDVYKTQDLVIEKLETPVKAETQTEIHPESAVIRSGIEGTDIEEYGMQYRKKGEASWIQAETEKGSTASDFTFCLEELEPNTQYEYRFFHRQITKNEVTYLDAETFTTKVKIEIPQTAEGSCGEAQITADKTEAWPGDTVTYTLTSCEEHTAVSVTLNGEEELLGNEEKQELTYEYEVGENDTVVTAVGGFRKKQISRVTDVPTIRMFADDERNASEKALLSYAGSLKDIGILYDNGTQKSDYQTEWTLAEGNSWNADGGSYTMTAVLPTREGEVSISRTAVVIPLPEISEPAVTPHAESAVIEAGFRTETGYEGAEIAEYGMEYRKAGAAAWSKAKPAEGSDASGFAFPLEGLQPNTQYEYRFTYRQAGRNDTLTLSSKDWTFTTMVKIALTEEGGCTDDAFTADKTEAWPGDTVTYTLTSCSEHTPTKLTVDGNEIPLENRETQTFTYTDTVDENDAVVTAAGIFRKKRISRVTDIPRQELFVEDISRETQKAAEEKLDALKDISVVYDNGTLRTDYQADWTLKPGESWHKGYGVYSYVASIPTCDGVQQFIRQVAVKTAPEQGNVDYEIHADSARISSGFEGIDVTDYGMEYRKKGEKTWTPAELEAGGTETGFTAVLEGLQQNTAYEIRYFYEQEGRDERTYLETLEFWTMVSIGIPSAEGCKEAKITADKTEAWPGDTVTYTVTSCEEHTPEAVTIHGVARSFENSESRTGIYRYTVREQDSIVEAKGSVAAKQISRVTDIPQIEMYADDERNTSEKHTEKYLDGLKDITVVYDNGTIRKDYQADWTLADDVDWHWEQGSRDYVADIATRSGVKEYVRVVVVKPISQPETASGETAKTGDANTGILWTTLMLLSGAALAELLYRRKRKIRR